MQQRLMGYWGRCSRMGSNVYRITFTRGIITENVRSLATLRVGLSGRAPFLILMVSLTDAPPPVSGLFFCEGVESLRRIEQAIKEVSTKIKCTIAWILGLIPLRPGSLTEVPTLGDAGDDTWSRPGRRFRVYAIFRTHAVAKTGGMSSGVQAR